MVHEEHALRERLGRHLRTQEFQQLTLAGNIRARLQALVLLAKHHRQIQVLLAQRLHGDQGHFFYRRVLVKDVFHFAGKHLHLGITVSHANYIGQPT